MANRIYTLDYTDSSKVDMVIKVMFEDTIIKRKVIRECVKHMREENTFALPITYIDKALSRTDKAAGMPYFSPVDKVQLLETITNKNDMKNMTLLKEKLVRHQAQKAMKEKMQNNEWEAVLSFLAQQVNGGMASHTHLRRSPPSQKQAVSHHHLLWQGLNFVIV